MTISTVKARLVEVLTAALPDTQVVYGPLSAVTTLKPRALSVGRAAGTREITSLSLTSAQERYTIDLLVSVALSGTSQQSADELALADYASAVDAIVVAHPDLGLGAGYTIVARSEFELVEVADDQGRAAQVWFAVAVTAID